MQRGAVIYRADQKIEGARFPEEPVVGTVDSLNDGRAVEVGIFGCEEIVGISIFLVGLITARQGGRASVGGVADEDKSPKDC